MTDVEYYFPASRFDSTSQKTYEGETKETKREKERQARQRLLNVSHTRPYANYVLSVWASVYKSYFTWICFSQEFKLCATHCHIA